MVLPNINLNYETRNTINTVLSNQTYNISRNQASSILKQFFKSSLQRLRTSLKLQFMKQKLSF